MTKIKKILAVLIVAFTITVGSSTPSFLAKNLIPSNAVLAEGKKANDLSKKVLSDQDVIFNGQANTSFTYRENADLSFFIQNTGDKEIHFMLRDPNDGKFYGGELKPGESVPYTFYAEYDDLPYGDYFISINNKDGSTGSFKMFVETRK